MLAALVTVCCSSNVLTYFAISSHYVTICQYKMRYTVDTEFSLLAVVFRLLNNRFLRWVRVRCWWPALVNFSVFRAHRVNQSQNIYSIDADMKINHIILLCVCICWACVSGTHQKFKSENVKVHAVRHRYWFRDIQILFLFSFGRYLMTMMTRRWVPTAVAVNKN